MNLPEDFTSKMKVLLQDEYDEFIASYEKNYFQGLRANTLKVSPQQLKSLMNTELTPVKWCENGFYYSESDFRAGKSPYYHAGLYYIQEPSAMAPASVMDICEGHRVLDICSAPGGKSTAIAAKLNGTGVLVCNDVSATRLKGLLKNIEIMGITNVIVSNEQPERLVSRFTGFFDRILVDAPCSGEGMFRKDPDAIKNWEPDKILQFCEIQRGILSNAAKMLKNGGRMMYSTCTFAPEENEQMIGEFLSEHSDFELIKIEHEKYGFAKGFGEYSGCARLLPHKTNGEGHFLAYLEKRGLPEEFETPVAKKTDIKGMELYHEFCEKFLNRAFTGNFELHGESLMLIPNGVPQLKGLRLMRSGFYLGDILNKRFEPSQALAMGMKKEDARFVIDFARGEEGLFRYLKGESFDHDAHDGWNLVCVDGFPLGFAKVLDGRIKNKYSKSWLMN